MVVSMKMPDLPENFYYSGEYRVPRKGEYYAFGCEPCVGSANGTHGEDEVFPILVNKDDMAIRKINDLERRIAELEIKALEEK